MPNNNLRILAIHQGWELYGSDRSFLLNLSVLSAQYANIDVIIPKEGPILEEIKKISKNVSIENIGKVEKKEAFRNPIKSIFYVFRSSFGARKKMKKYDLVYVNTIVPFAYLLGGFLLRKTIIIHVREIPSPFIAKIFKFWFKACRFHLIFNSYATQASFKMKLYKRGIVIQNAVDPILKCNFEKTDKINLLLIGRINAWKGHFFFLNTFSTLNSEDKKAFHVNIVGEAPVGQDFYKEELISQIRSLNLKDYITLKNFEKDPVMEYNKAEFVIVPSILPEPFGRVVVEAFSIGKPVVAANHGGLSETVIDGFNGVHFKPKSEEDLRKILQNIVQNKYDSKEMSKNALESYRTHYSVEVYEKKMLNFIRSLAKKC